MADPVPIYGHNAPKPDRYMYDTSPLAKGPYGAGSVVFYAYPSQKPGKPAGPMQPDGTKRFGQEQQNPPAFYYTDTDGTVPIYGHQAGDRSSTTTTRAAATGGARETSSSTRTALQSRERYRSTFTNRTARPIATSSTGRSPTTTAGVTERLRSTLCRLVTRSAPRRRTSADRISKTMS
jgi:hypothetical protein